MGFNEVVSMNEWYKNWGFLNTVIFKALIVECFYIYPKIFNLQKISSGKGICIYCFSVYWNNWNFYLNFRVLVRCYKPFELVVSLILNEFMCTLKICFQLIKWKGKKYYHVTFGTWFDSSWTFLLCITSF